MAPRRRAARELSDGDTLEFAMADGRDLGLDDRSSDAVVFHTSLSHIPGYPRARSRKHSACCDLVGG